MVLADCFECNGPPRAVGLGKQQPPLPKRSAERCRPHEHPNVSGLVADNHKQALAQS